MIDIIIRVVPDYGFLPILEKDGKEVYRGEFQKTPLGAMSKCQDRIASHMIDVAA